MGDSTGIALVSGCDGAIRYASPVGHQLYARRHGLAYHLEVAPFPGVRGYWHKVAALRAHLRDHDWLVWLDDDAFVTDTESRFLRDALEQAESASRLLVIASSPPDELNGAWAAYNSGVMALRCVPETGKLLSMVAEADLAEVGRWWDRERLGMFTRGDQDALVWALEQSGLCDSVHRVDPLVWNARPWHYRSSLTDCPVVHFPGHPDKTLAIHRFARRLGVGETLVAGTAYDVALLAPLDRQRVGTSRLGLLGRGALGRSRRTTGRVGRKVRWIRETGRWR